MGRGRCTGCTGCPGYQFIRVELYCCTYLCLRYPTLPPLLYLLFLLSSFSPPIRYLPLPFNTFRWAPKEKSARAINRNLIKSDNVDYKMLQELFSLHINRRTIATPTQTPILRLPLSTLYLDGEAGEAFMKSSTTLFVFNGKIFLQLGTSRRPHTRTHPLRPCDSVALDGLLC